MKPTKPPPHLTKERDVKLWKGAEAVLTRNLCGARLLGPWPVRAKRNGKG